LFENEKKLNFFPKINIDRYTGLAMLATTVIALIFANSPIADEFHHLLKKKLILGFPDGPWIKLSIEEWINDGLMVVFFFMAGLEMKREIAVGELSSPRKAALPLFAALGGMALPAAIFLAINWNQPHIDGWGIPIATDIAYSLGILGLLGKRINPEIRIFLIALAIFDDLGAILVIAFFYSSELNWIWLICGGATFAGLVVMNARGVKMLRFYIFGGLILWICFLYSGVHPTIAGVMFAMTIPVTATLKSKTFLKKARMRINSLSNTDLDSKNPLTEKAQDEIIERMRIESKRSNPPLIRVERTLREFNSFVIIPLFVLANSGVELSLDFYKVYEEPLALGIMLGLLLGKVSGVMLFSWLSIKLNWADLPISLRMKDIPGVGFLAGIGFTMSLFITNLGLSDSEAIETAKIAILTSSLTSGVIGYFYLRTLRKKPSEKV
jgi:NhaA family Na+:H+ antiporter